MPASAAMKQNDGVLMTATATPVRSMRQPGHVQKVLMKNVIIAAAIPPSTAKIPAQQTDVPLIMVHVFSQTNIARTIPRHPAQQIMTVQVMLSA